MRIKVEYERPQRGLGGIVIEILRELRISYQASTQGPREKNGRVWIQVDVLKDEWDAFLDHKGYNPLKTGAVERLCKKIHVQLSR